MEILLGREEIAERVAALGKEISSFYGEDTVTLIVIANGALIFGADLAREISSPLEWDILSVNSYSGLKSTGKINLRSGLKLNPAGRRILLADEVLDTGNTLLAIKQILLDAGAKEVRTAVMVEKDLPRKQEVAHADWCGAKLPDRYLIGYGLDADEKYRNLPFIAALK